MTDERDRRLSDTRTALGEPAVDRAWEEGRRVPCGKAVAEALVVVEEIASRHE